eukprot:gene17786-biopygen26750
MITLSRRDSPGCLSGTKRRHDRRVSSAAPNTLSGSMSYSAGGTRSLTLCRFSRMLVAALTSFMRSSVDILQGQVGTDHFLPGTAGDGVSFSVQGVDLCIVNSLRRAIIAGIETAAFDASVTVGGVRVIENTLVVRNTGNEVLDVVSGDFVVRNASGVSFQQERLKRVFPVDERSGDSVLLTVLRPNIICGGVGEAVHITATARLGSGREHAQWSPVCSCYFRNHETSDSAFRFFVESVNPSLSPYYIVFLGFRFLVRAVIALSDDIRDERVSFEDSTVSGGMRSILLPGLDHTIGNLLQGLLYDLWVNKGRKSRVSFVGYFKRHPLVDDITLKLQLVGDEFPNNAYDEVLLEGLSFVREHLESLTLEWIRFCGMKGMGLVAIEKFVELN